MFQTFRNAWKIPELKNRLLFTLAILVVYRLGCAIPVPFVTSSALTQMFSNGNMLAYLDMMSGGALSRCTLFALGVTPYINASIIVQLLTVAIPSLENIAKEPDGQQKLQQITRYAGGIIALIMSLGYYFVVRNMGALKYTSGAAGIFTAVVIIATFTAGAQLITWCGEQIDDKGIGNGLSLLIFSSIVSNWSSLYTTVAGLLTRAAAGESQFYIFLPLLLVLALVVIVFIVIMTNAERRITIQYAKRVVGRKQMGGQNSYLPLKLNMTGVMPIIFASAMVSIPGTIGSFLREYQTMVNVISGLVVILFGLNFLGIFKWNLFRGGGKTVNSHEMGFFSAMLFGMVFSLGWTPCVGAFLGSALMLASQQGHVIEGMLMLLCYSLGLGIPFLLSAVLIDYLKSAFNWIKKHYRIINTVSGCFLILVGILMATGTLGQLLSLLN